MGAFDRERETCLSEAGITDPDRVAADSTEEDRFLQCMNAVEWCTDVFRCRKPEA